MAPSAGVWVELELIYVCCAICLQMQSSSHTHSPLVTYANLITYAKHSLQMQTLSHMHNSLVTYAQVITYAELITYAQPTHHIYKPHLICKTHSLYMQTLSHMQNSLVTYVNLITYAQLIMYANLITYAQLTLSICIAHYTHTQSSLHMYRSLHMQSSQAKLGSGWGWGGGALSRRELFVGAHLSIITLWGAFLTRSTFWLLPSLERPGSWTLRFPETLVSERHSNHLISAR